MDFLLDGETIKTRVCSLSKKLIPITVIVGRFKKEFEGTEEMEGSPLSLPRFLRPG